MSKHALETQPASQPCVRLRSHKHEYESGTVRVPVYEFRQTRVCVYFNGSRSHTYEYGLSVNFTRTRSFCAGRVFIQLAESKLLVNNINIIYKNRYDHIVLTHSCELASFFYIYLRNGAR